MSYVSWKSRRDLTQHRVQFALPYLLSLRDAFFACLNQNSKKSWTRMNQVGWTCHGWCAAFFRQTTLHQVTLSRYYHLYFRWWWCSRLGSFNKQGGIQRHCHARSAPQVGAPGRKLITSAAQACEVGWKICKNFILRVFIIIWYPCLIMLMYIIYLYVWCMCIIVYICTYAAYIAVCYEILNCIVIYVKLWHIISAESHQNIYISNQTTLNRNMVHYGIYWLKINYIYQCIE